VFEVKPRPIKPGSDTMLNNLKKNTKIRKKKARVSLIIYNAIKIIKKNKFNLNIKREYIS
jgi:hypothetical protein